MAKRITFGEEIIKLLEKYGLNKLWEVPTKYKEGYTTIDFAYSYVSNIDKLKTTVDYIEFTVDEETDGFIDGMMYLNKNGDYETIEVKFIEDVKYFIENANWKNSDLMESKKSLKESKEDRLIKEIESYCNNNRIRVRIEQYDDKVDFTFDDFTYEEISELRNIIHRYVDKFEIDDYLAGNGRWIIVKL